MTHLKSNTCRNTINKRMTQHFLIVSPSMRKGITRMQVMAFCMRELIFFLGFVPFIMDSCMQGGMMGDVAYLDNLSLCFNSCQFFYAQGLSLFLCHLPRLISLVESIGAHSLGHSTLVSWISRSYVIIKKLWQELPLCFGCCLFGLVSGVQLSGSLGTIFVVFGFSIWISMGDFEGWGWRRLQGWG